MIGGWNTSPCRSRRQVERKPVLMWTWMTTWSTMDCCECAVVHDRRPNEGTRRPGGMRTRKKKWAESAEMENRPTHKQTKRTCVRALYRAEHTGHEGSSRRSAQNSHLHFHLERKLKWHRLLSPFCFHRPKVQVSSSTRTAAGGT